MPRFTRLRALPWLTAAQVGFLLRQNYVHMSDRERDKLKALLRDSRGWPGNLTDRERKELLRLLGRLDPVGVARNSFPFPGGRSRKQ